VSKRRLIVIVADTEKFKVEVVKLLIQLFPVTADDKLMNGELENFLLQKHP